MRKLVCFSIGFSVAALLCVDFLWAWNLLPETMIFGILSLAGFWFVRKRNLSAIPVVICFGLCVGFGWFSLFNMLYLEPIAAYDETVVPLHISVSSYRRDYLYSKSVEGIGKLNGIPYKMRIYLNEDLEVQPGDVLEGDYRLRLTSPSGSKSSEFYQGSGIFLIASPKGKITMTRPDRLPLRSIPVVLAEKIKNNLDTCFPEDTAPFANALLLGDTSSLNYQDDTALKVSGIRHIAAVSGLHIGILFAVILLLCGKNLRIASMVATPILFFFAAMTGFTPSVVRACIMTEMITLGWSLFEAYDSLTGLALACLLMLAVNPFVIHSVSFLLSVSSVTGILVFAAPLYRWQTGLFPKKKPYSILSRVVRSICQTTSVSVSAMVITVPISAHFFGEVSLVSILTNLLTLWAVGILFCGIAFVGIVSFIQPTIAMICAGALSWLVRFVLFVSSFLASFPFSAVYTQSKYISIWLAVVYILAAAFFVTGKKHVKGFLSAGMIGLVLAICLSVCLPQLDAFRMTVIDVGQGQSILLESGGKRLLIDCGGSTDTLAANSVAQTLLSRGITHLDAIAVTHYDQDHTGAIQNLLTRIRVERFYLPDLQDNGFREKLESYSDGEQTLLADKVEIDFGGGKLTFSGPGKMKADNENCMCILFESEECDILITGDRGRIGEKNLIEVMELSDVDVLIAGHHGSKNSTSLELLKAVTPEIVIFSAGEGNSYGHPSREVLERVSQFNCEIYRTDLQGSVVVRRNSWRKKQFPMAAFRN